MLACTFKKQNNYCYPVMDWSINRQGQLGFTYKETVRAGRSGGVAVSSRLLQSTEVPVQVQFWAQGKSELHP